MKKLFLAILFISFFSNSNAQVFLVDTIYYHGNPDNRINLIIMGDGYQSGEMTQFRLDAQTVTDYFLNIEPFNTYENFFNVFAIEVISNESGANHPATATDENTVTQPVAIVDNYLKTTFDFGGTHRCVLSNQSGIVYSVANINFPAWDYINVIINSTYYGGCASGIAYTTMNSSSAEVFAHEFGHIFGQLSDEYESGAAGCNPGNAQRVNVSQEIDTSLLVWKNWLTTAPIPTPPGVACNLIGLYEGAQYCDSNWYRPKCDCKMRSLNQPFCEVCYEQLIYKISTKVKYIENPLPLSTSLFLCRDEQKLFSVNVLNNKDSTIRAQWFVDNVLVSNNSSFYNYNSSMFSTGNHQLKVVTYDTTLKARKQLTSYSQTWNLNVFSASIFALDTVNFCTPDSVRLKSSTSSTYSYQWLKNNVVISGETDSMLTVKNSGSYSVIVTKGNCKDTTAQINVAVIQSPTAEIALQGNDTICSGDSVLMSTSFCNSCIGQWKRNGIDIVGANQNSFFANTTGSYTIEIMDTVSGCFSLSETQDVFIDICTDVGFINEGNTILIYPNPSAGKILIEGNSKDKKTITIEVFNLLGNFLTTLVNNELFSERNVREIDCSELPAGIYFLKIKTESKIYLNRLIILK